MLLGKALAAAAAFGLLAVLAVPQAQSAANNLRITVRATPTGTSTRLNVVASFPLEVQFTAESNGTSPTAYAWQFGDGSNGTGFSATHYFGSSCVYAVSLRAVDAKGAVSLGGVTIAAYGSTTAEGALMSCPLSGTASLTHVQLAGSFFTPGKQVQVLLDGLQVASAVPDRGGSWSFNATALLRTKPNGSVYRFTTVPAGPEADFLTLPGVKVSPRSVASGGSFALEGLSYAPGGAVTVFLGGVEIGRTTCNATGSFMAQLTVPQASPFSSGGVFKLTTSPPATGEGAALRVTASTQPPPAGPPDLTLLLIGGPVAAVVLIAVATWWLRRRQGGQIPTATA